MTYVRILLVALIVACAPVARGTHVVLAAAAPQAAPAAPHAAPGQEGPVAREAEEGQAAHGGGWMPVVAKAFNFAILVGVLVYFLRAPLNGYLDGRIRKVREDLVTAAETRETASRQLAEIDARLKALPAELEALKARGAEEIAAERVRIEHAAAAERERLLDQTRREIDMRLRIARRDLVEHAATLAVDVASTKIRGAITPEDQARLIDRYATQLQAGGESTTGARQ